MNANSLKLGIILASPRFLELLLKEVKHHKFVILGGGMVVSSLLIFLCKQTQPETLPTFIRADKKTLRQIKEYVSGLTHDMQTPIAKIQMLLDRLHTRGITPSSTIVDIRNAVFAISEYRKRYLMNLTTFLDHDSANIVDIDLPTLIDEVLYDMHQIFKRRADMVTQFSEKSVYIKSNFVLLKDIITNMYHNAFSHGDGYITLNTIYNKDSCVVTMTNHCDSTDNADLFASKLTRHRTSHGYGLNHIRNIVSFLGGQITYRIQDKVCTSILTIMTTNTSYLAIESTNSHLSDNYIVAVVEDDDILRTMTTHMIHRYCESIECYDFADRDSFVNWIHMETRCVIVLLDFQLCQDTMGGIEIAQTLKHTPNIIMYGITANNDLMDEALQAGMKAVFPKPLNLNILKRILSNVATPNDCQSREQTDELDLTQDVIRNLDNFNDFVESNGFTLHKQLHNISGKLSYINTEKSLQVKGIHDTLLKNIVKTKTDISKIRTSISDLTPSTSE
jgi:CheY-like chemotaxis protein